MKIKEIWKVAIKAGIDADPRPVKEIRAVLADRKKAYKALKGIRKEIVDKESHTNPYALHDSARHVDLPLMNLHTPADNHVHTFLSNYIEKEQPRKLSDLIDIEEFQGFRRVDRTG